MKIFFALISIFIGISIHAQEERDIDYIRRHALIAVEEMEIYKIPASITLSQGILETGGGQSRLAEQANNHFGIKCKKEWTGEKIYHDDDARGECFRKYPSVKDSYRDHSKFLAERPYYKALFDLAMDDYKAWAHGLKKAGYATNPRYAQILIDRIEKYQLNEFDNIQKDQVYDKVVNLYGPVDILVVNPNYQNIEKEVVVAQVEEKEVEEKQETIKMEVPVRDKNPRARLLRHPIGRDYIVVEKGETLSHISNLYDISVEELMENNDLTKSEKLIAGQYLFFGKKRNKGDKRFYTVEKGDNMYLISQKAGIKLDHLYRRNRMNKGDEPKAGEILYLKGRKPKK